MEKEATQLRKSTDELKDKIQVLINEFTDKVGFCDSIYISVDTTKHYDGSGIKMVTNIIKVNVTV